MNWNVVITGNAEKQLKRLPGQDETHIRDAIVAMEENPFTGDIVKLGGRYNAWRRRVGNYRIMYKLLSREEIIFIYDIRRRTSATY
jgi:mRNA-degrading endonuclease RelE of RelBE toxin-antitoxin system